MNPLNRRYFLTMLGGFPLLPRILSAEPLRAGKAPRSLILLWMDGGMSHLDTLDAKPEAPPDIRGDLGVMRASVDGVFVSAHLPRIAALMKECALVRSITSPEGNHDRGSHFMLTGRKPSPVLRYPSVGSLLAEEQMADAGAFGGLPPYVAIPDAHPYARQGFLPVARAPFELSGDPSKPGFRVKNLQPAPGMERPLQLLERVDALDGAPRSESEAARDAFLAQGRYLSLNPDVRALFDLEAERPETRTRYGRHFLGQSCLLARRLVQGGVRTVLVRHMGWDHHAGIANALTYGFPPKLPALDEALSALHMDLRQRGLLEDVLVVLASEFGRTPRINPAGGRDHWSRASSVLLFGAGVRAGAVFGSTDARGEEPASDPVSPQDLYATILTALGADVSQVLRAPDGRPVRVTDENARIMHEILGQG